MAEKTITVTHKKTKKEKEIDLHKSDVKDMNWMIKAGTGGQHYKSLESVKKNMERQYKNHDVAIS